MNNIQNTKLLFTFDNDTTYVIYMESDLNEDSRFIERYTGQQIDAVLDGNPLGVTTSNSKSISIYDPNNLLMPNNSESPYFNYLRSGVKIETFVYEDEQWKEDGTYYSTSWDVGYSQGGNDVAMINASDKLQYILSQEIPKLPIYSGLTIKEFVKLVFNAIGISDDEYYIDESLNLTLRYGINTEDTVGTFLNNVGQALLAHINVDRYGIIQIRPALSSYGETWDLTDDDFSLIESKINESSCMYSKARLNYTKTGKDMNGSLAGNSGVTLEIGLNEFNGLSLSGARANEITDVSFELPKNVNIDTISNFKYTAYQNGIDIKITNNSGSVIEDVMFRVNGRYVTGIEKSEEADVVGSDTKVSNILNVYNDLVQNMTDAKNLVNKISEYLANTQYIVYIETTLPARVSVGDMIRLNSTIEKFNGTYKIIECNTDYSIKNYYKNITVCIDNTVEEVG